MAAARQILWQRACLYDLLSRLYGSEVDVPLLRRMLSGSRGAAGGVLPAEFTARVSALGIAQTTHELTTEFAALFLGGSRNRRVFPYESVYVSTEHLLMQEVRDAVAIIYEDAQLSRRDNFPEPEDHLALELAYMAHLNMRASQNIQAAPAALNLQMSFCGRHLMAWVPEFCADLRKATMSAFYFWLAEFTGDFLSAEDAALRQLHRQLIALGDMIGENFYLRLEKTSIA